MSDKPDKRKKPEGPEISPRVYTAYVDGLNLRSVRMVEHTVKLHKVPSDSEELSYTIEFGHGVMEHPEVPAFMAKYTMVISNPAQETVAEIEASFAAECHASGPPPPGFIEVFAPGNLSRLVYPFFREVVAGATAKMGLHTLFVPLYIFGGKRPPSGGKSSKP